MSSAGPVRALPAPADATTSAHGAGCGCTRCQGFGPGNSLSVRHGATSPRLIGQRATVEKRRLLRQIGLRQADLDSLGRALVQNWARAAAALYLMDTYAAEHGLLDAEGQPRGFARLYVSMLNCERLALGKLGEYLRARERDPFADLAAHLARGGADG